MNYVNNFRGVVILSIILVHCSTVIPSHPGTLRNIVDSIFGNGTFYFVALAGFLFSATTSDFAYLPYLKGKARTVLIPYIITSAPAVLMIVTGLIPPQDWMDQDWFNQSSALARAAILYVTGAQLGPLWFIPMIVLFYLASPIFLALKGRSTILWAVLVIATVIGVIVNRPDDNSNALQSFLYFSPAFVLGQLLHSEKALYTGRSINSLLLLGVGVAIAIVLVFLVHDGEVFSRFTLLLDIWMTIALFGVFYHYGNFHSKWLDLFARLSFYLFFVHGYFVGALRKLGPRIFVDVPGVVTVGISLAITVVGCLVIFVMCKAILGNRSRYIIGA